MVTGHRSANDQLAHVVKVFVNLGWPYPTPHLGVEMEDDTSGDTSNGNARPPLPIPPPLTDLVPPIESFSSEVDMELEDVDKD
ncbi:hypothetical protein PAXRUDRAFT_20734 [Paxillus rubicundulus Ve08.2h10]|uniref:Uncharacterized protein n=1 Tax=Paxillus rubicundulus Ve08.2h10 TaxID=930991 RepID=A0A0D0BPU6_9AGAM|nr:hypothetical protein PAXRUDRAFT_20734 [Paxillus rubicundulus Ve08.2h10]